MSPSPIPDAFSRTNCDLLQLWASVTLKPSVAGRVRGCMPGKRPRRYVFAKTYPGDSKLSSLGARAVVERMKGNLWAMEVLWAPPGGELPFPHGSFDDFLKHVSPAFGQRQAEVRAWFSYDMRKTTSLFRRVSLPDGAGVIDELVGFAGVKKDAEGKILYKIEIEIGEKNLLHRVSFSQPVRFSEDLPIPLLERASKISLLGLIPKEER